MLPSSQEIVELANREARMRAACRITGVKAPSGRDSGSRAYCPWGEFSHPDGGRDPAMRVWPDHAFCFACWEYFTPVRLVARVLEVSDEAAALRLLEEVGYKPASYADHWQRASAPPEPDRAALAQALRNACEATAGPSWRQAQSDPRVGWFLSQCLAYLVQVTTDEDARTWLALAAEVMAKVLEGLR
jgi:hypothetical protein